MAGNHVPQGPTSSWPVVDSGPEPVNLGSDDSNASNQDPATLACFDTSNYVASLSLGQQPDRNFNRQGGIANASQTLRDKCEIKSARNAESSLVHTVEFELVHGDTLVYVDLPDPPRNAKKQADCHNIAYRSHSFLVHSDKLLATGSPKFEAMLRPSYQLKLQSRRKMSNKLPEGVRYILDLTPPSEGDELVFQMTELSLTPGIMKWWSSYKFHNVDPSLVSGHDDVCSCRRLSRGSLEFDSDEEFGPKCRDAPKSPRNGSVKSTKLRDQGESEDAAPSCPPTPRQLEEMRDGGDRSIYDTPPFRNIPDYCPVRHRNTIIRLMLLIEGRGVLIDSASRMWTLVALAKIFDCTSVVRHHVVQWIINGSNARFIEVLPEETLRVGFALENEQLTQCAFRILVNELALSEAATDQVQYRDRRTTLLGRRLGDCGDELDNIIQHAARALVERVSLIRTQLCSPDLFDIWELQEWRKLRKLQAVLASHKGKSFADALQTLERLMKALPRAVTLFLDDAVKYCDQDHTTLWSMDADRATYVLPQDFEKLSQIMPKLNPTQKLLCPFVWNDLGERCSWPMYITLRKADGLGRPNYASLLRQVENALQRVAARLPADVCDEFFDAGAATDVPNLQVKSPLIDLDRLDWQVKDALAPLTLSWVRHDIDPPLNLTRHLLLTLTMNEIKFLPLWAGGNNDGSGGVFESFVPPTDMGPIGPGPAYHTGRTVRSAAPSVADTVVDDMSATRIEGDTTVASVKVNDGISTVFRPDAVIAARDMSLTSDSFTMHGVEYDEARAAVPAGQEIPRTHLVDWTDGSECGADDDAESMTLDLGPVAESSDFEALGAGNGVMSEWSDSDESLVVVGHA
ncbi:hypothetical protein HIM_02603 [Hirsutella minnesotensis 3608]|nr:hypothetical protein HIM_02603 [Hirsutella minnesotensis 3608]